MIPSFTDHAAPRILIVDDQPSNVRLLEHTLRRAGYADVSSTIDPGEVAALHARNRYGLILLDLQMPGLDGFGVMKQLRDVDSTAAILVISADPSQKSAALAAGASSFLNKPFLLTDVVARVQELLAGA
jgi:adenylate cyclase